MAFCAKHQPRTLLMAGSLCALAVALTSAQDSDEKVRGIQVPTEPGPTESDYRARHALVIGIDQYQDDGFADLGFAVADAQGIATLLREKFKFPEENIRLLLNEDASRANLNEALEEWVSDPRRVHSRDLMVVFFAGHGVTRELPGGRERGYLVPADGRMGDGLVPAWSSLIGMNQMEDVSEAIPALHGLFLLDCCFGGQTMHRSVASPRAVLKSRARQVLTAGGKDEVVLDGGGGGHSIFTGTVLRALSGEADGDGDGVVAFGELSTYVKNEVTRRTSNRQTPLMSTFPDHEGGNVALFAPGLQPRGLTTAETFDLIKEKNAENQKRIRALADAVIVEELLQESHELWPQVPSMVPRFRAWLSQARAALGRLPVHNEVLARILEIEELSREVEELIPRSGDPVDWAKLQVEQRWLHSQFEALVQDLEELRERIPEVEGRIEVAEALWQRSIGDHEEEWEDAIFSISLDERFDGLEMEPQLGLVPIGPDPDTGLWEFVHIVSGTIPERDASSERLILTEESGLVLVLIPGGTFRMGGQSTNAALPNYDPIALDRIEGPVHEVTLAPFFLGKHEVPQSVWARFCGSNPANYLAGRQRGGIVSAAIHTPPTLLHPVEQVNWVRSSAVLRQMDLQLPTEAQWEYACRAGTGGAWWTGPEKSDLGAAANIADRTYERTGGLLHIKCDQDVDDGFLIHAPIGSLRANDFGLHDMLGNVYEWVRDGQDAGYSSDPAPGDGYRGDPEAQGFRGTRGGAFDVPALYTRASVRLALDPQYQYINQGLRASRSVRQGE